MSVGPAFLALTHASPGLGRLGVSFGLGPIAGLSTDHARDAAMVGVVVGLAFFGALAGLAGETSLVAPGGGGAPLAALVGALACVGLGGETSGAATVAGSTSRLSGVCVVVAPRGVEGETRPISPSGATVVVKLTSE